MTDDKLPGTYQQIGAPVPAGTYFIKTDMQSNDSTACLIICLIVIVVVLVSSR